MGVRHGVVFATGVSLLVAGLVVVPSRPAHGGAVGVSPASPVVEPEARRRPRVRVVPPGPASPTSPTIDSYYYLLQHRKCADLRLRTSSGTNAEDLLFSALADLCLGARSASYSADWSATQEALDATGDLDDCLSLSGRRALTNALVNHQRTGRKRPDFRPVGTGSTCVPEVTTGLLLQNSPDATPSLLILGQRLFEADAVRVNGIWLEATSRNAVEGTECARVDVLGWTPPQPGTPITVAVRGRGYTTATESLAVGGALTDDDLGNLDTTACLPS